MGSLTDDLPLFQAYVALGISAVVPIYLGSFASLPVRYPVKRRRNSRTASEADADDESSSDEEELDRLTSEDALWFPIIGSVVLATLYLVFKYLNKELINVIFSWYFAFMGTAAVMRMFVKSAKGSISRTTYSKLSKWRFVLYRNTKEYTSLRFTSLHLSLLLLSIAVTALQQATKFWALSNLVALAFAFNAVSLLKVDSFKTGSLLLMGLFVYDIYWVFFSERAFGDNVMVSVAQNFDAPIKILWPKSLSFTDSSGFSMLGLGDIVVPGTVISLALRYDQFLSRTTSNGAKAPIPSPSQRLAFPKPYFTAVFTAYILGLTTTIVVMHTFQAAQPALLYLSPACVGAAFLTAVRRGEVGSMWKYEDGEEREKEKREKEKEEKEKENRSRGTGKGEEAVFEDSEDEDVRKRK
ncbi:hypothetical protein BT69DRAFT_1224266 [Atractiella rhizophila]|nr:hypothetical protein BT69DRAFT_1224266 [Atractiella rhizophila]